MAVDYRLSSLEVANFRGLPSLEFTFPSGGGVVTLIGANNAGKSTVMDAIGLALQAPGFYSYSPDRFDFFCMEGQPPQREFGITVKFARGAAGLLPAVRGAVGDPTEVHGVQVFGSYDKRDRPQHTVRLLDESLAPILLLDSIPLKGPAREKWKPHGISSGRRYARWQDLADDKPEVWLLRADNLFASLYTFKTGPIHRLAKMLATEFFQTKWDYKGEDGAVRKMPAAMNAAHRFLTHALQAFPFWKDDLKPRLEAALSGYVGRQARMDLRPAIESIEEWLSEQLLLSFAADGGGAVTPLDRMGHGWQSLVRLAALDVLAQYPQQRAEKVVLMFEEPETYLHPHLARKLRKVLATLAARGWTVLLTTHSPNLVSFEGPHLVSRLARVGSAVACRSLKVDQLDDAVRFQERLDERGAHEMLFAQRVVICEGLHDVFALRSYIERFQPSLDLDGRSVSIVRAGDVTTIPLFARMAGNLGIPWAAVIDQDQLADGTLNSKTDGVRKAVNKLKSGQDAVFEWPGKLEECFGLNGGKATPAVVGPLIDQCKELNSLEQAFPTFAATCEKVVSWINQAPPMKRAPGQADDPAGGPMA